MVPPRRSPLRRRHQPHGERVLPGRSNTLQSPFSNPYSRRIPMTRIIQRVAVIGAGTMGGGIAAHFANAGYQVDLLDVPGSGPDKMKIVAGGWDRVKKAKPA